MALNLQLNAKKIHVKQIYACIFIYLIGGHAAFAQPATKPVPGSIITGRIIDSTTAKPIAYATVALYRKADHKVVNGAAANDLGIFTINNVETGSYICIFDFIGYKKLTKDSVIVTGNIKKISLGDIVLSEKLSELSTVTVTGQKSVIEMQADKIVFNVDHDLTSQGGVATDVLKKIPQVSVDIDGNIEVQGNSVRFLIDGKPSTIFGNNITDVLQSIPSSQIESIEVITSPGAKYDAEGTGGIINIILKKNDAYGFNASLSTSIGTRLENGSLNVNARSGKFGVHASLSGNTNIRSDVINSMDRTSYDTMNNKEIFQQDGKTGTQRFGYQAGLGFDWDITRKDFVTLHVGYNMFGTNGSGTTNQQIITYSSSGSLLSNFYSTLNNSSLYKNPVLDYSLSYRKQFDREKQELNILVNSSNSNYISQYTQNQASKSGDTIYSGSKGNNPATNNETDISMDYAQPFSKDFTIETGIKAVLTNITSTKDVYSLNINDQDYIFEPNQSNLLNYKRQIYAAYLSGSFNIAEKWHGRAGLRYEYTLTQADFGTGEHINIPDYNTLSPSFVISRDIGKGQSLKLNYNHRIERPQYWRLNPFVNATDPKNITTGNPNLQPELSDKIETGYNKSFDKGGNLNVALFYQASNHDIKPYVTYYSKLTNAELPGIGDTSYSNVAVTNYANIGLEQKTGLSISGSVPITSKLNTRGNIQVYDRHIINTYVPGQNSNGIDYRINMNITYIFDKGFSAEAFGNFNSPVTGVQGKTPSWSSYSFAARKEIFHKKGSIGFTTTSPFNEYVVMNTAISGSNFTLNSTRKIPIRSFGISFIYRFGKMEFKKEQREEENNDNGGTEG
jgi:ferric enterobactin receptor